MFGRAKKKELVALEERTKESHKSLESDVTGRIADITTNINKIFGQLDTSATLHDNRIGMLESQMIDVLQRVNDLVTTCDNDRKARNERFDATNGDIDTVRKYIDDFEKRQVQTDNQVYSIIGKIQNAVEELDGKLSLISDAITGDFFNLAAYQHEKDRDTMRHHGNSVEWIVKNVSQKVQKCLEGHAVVSPAFTAKVPSIGVVENLQLAFYPRGDRGGGCSLYLQHPVDAPWMRFYLTIGSQKRGPFDTIYKGPPNFCDLGREVNEGLPKEWDAVRLSVEFIAPNAESELNGDHEAALFATSELIPGSDATDMFFPFEKMADIIGTTNGHRTNSK
eukprot:GEMP01075369.1.p1 GENE.GEMP01075369.1~~GEMP01075369.1.p1  ORF type:complete len:354 (+),score=71.28 GEMP01075369.1:55-1062(+)